MSLKSPLALAMVVLLAAAMGFLIGRQTVDRPGSQNTSIDAETAFEAKNRGQAQADALNQILIFGSGAEVELDLRAALRHADRQPSELRRELYLLSLVEQLPAADLTQFLDHLSELTDVELGSLSRVVELALQRLALESPTEGWRYLTRSLLNWYDLLPIEISTLEIYLTQWAQEDPVAAFVAYQRFPWTDGLFRSGRPQYGASKPDFIDANRDRFLMQIEAALEEGKRLSSALRTEAVRQAAAVSPRELAGLLNGLGDQPLSRDAVALLTGLDAASLKAAIPLLEREPDREHLAVALLKVHLREGQPKAALELIRNSIAEHDPEAIASGSPFAPFDPFGGPTISPVAQRLIEALFRDDLFVRRSTDLSLAELTAFSSELPGWYRQEAFEILAQRMAREASQQETVAWIEAMPDGVERASLFNPLLSQLFEEDSQQAFALAQSQEIDLLEAGFLHHVVNEVAKTDSVEAARLALQQAKGGRIRDSVYDMSIQLLARGEPTQAMDVFLLQPPGYEREVDLRPFFSELYAYDVELPLVFAERLQAGEEKEEALRLLAAHDDANPEALLAYAMEHPDSFTRRRLSVHALTEILSELPEHGGRTEALRGTLESLSSVEDPLLASQLTVSVFEELDPEDLDTILPVAAVSFPDLYPSILAKAIEEEADADPWSAANRLAQADLSEAQRVGATQQVVNAMLDRDLQGAAQWVETLAPGRARDYAVASLGRQVWQADYAAALEWMSAIDDSRLRVQNVRAVVHRWHEMDPQTALGALEAAPLAPEEKSEVRSMVLEGRWH